MSRIHQSSTETAGAGCPPEVLDWIAWYPEDDLPERIRGSIDAHAAQCAECREEIARMQAEEGSASVDVPDPERVFARVRARIQQDDGTTRVTIPENRTPLRRERPLRVASRRMAMAASLALALGAGLVGAGLSTIWQGEGDVYYKPASDQDPIGVADVVQLAVVFRPEVPFGRLHEVLNEVGATVVAGPTRGGVMRLHLPKGSDPQAVAARLRSGDVSVALFAEPVVP